MQDSEQLEQKASSPIVTTSNAFLRSHYHDLDSVMFLRLFNIVIAQIKRTDKDFNVYKVPFTSIIANKTRGGTYYKMINSLASDALKVQVDIPEGVDRISKYPIFSKCTLDAKENVLEVHIHPDLKSHFILLKNHFTQYYLEEFIRLPSVYSQRIYQLLYSWKDRTFWRVSLDTLHQSLCSSPSMRKDFKEFRVKALEQAHKDILRETSLYFRWDAEKTGRKVTHITFYFERLSDESEAELKKNDHATMQKKTNKCYEKHQTADTICSPKKNSRLCKFCLERGRMSTKQERLFDD